MTIAAVLMPHLTLRTPGKLPTHECGKSVRRVVEFHGAVAHGDVHRERPGVPWRRSRGEADTSGCDWDRIYWLPRGMAGMNEPRPNRTGPKILLPDRAYDARDLEKSRHVERKDCRRRGGDHAPPSSN